jgi:hypothetical protein
MAKLHYEDRFPIVEAYLAEAFPGAVVRRLPMNWEAPPNVKGHDWDAQLWRAEADSRDYDLGITEEALEELSPERLAHALRYNPIRQHLVECSGLERVWIFSGGAVTKARLGESPSL